MEEFFDHTVIFVMGFTAGCFFATAIFFLLEHFTKKFIKRQA